MLNKATALSILCVLLLATAARAQLNVPQIAAQESGVQRISYLKSGETLYNISWTIKRFEENGRSLYKYEGRGDNGKSGAERIDWTEESVVEISQYGLLTRYWKKRSTGAEQMDWSVTYDWQRRQMHYAWNDRASGKGEDKTIGFERNALAGDALNWALRGFPFEKGAGFEIRGQIMFTDGTVIEGRIIHRGEEKIETAFGTVDAYKLELKPAGSLGLVAPDMYMWFAKSEPHAWLRFDGRDEGLLNPRTKNVLIKFEPREWIK